MSEAAALIKRLEQAPTGSRELSDEVLRAIGRAVEKEVVGRTFQDKSVETVLWRDTTGIIRRTRPSPTESVDSVIALVPEGWHIHRITESPNLESWRSYLRFVVELWPISGDSGIDPSFWDNPHAHGATLPLALCAALLRAKEAEG